MKILQFFQKRITLHEEKVVTAEGKILGYVFIEPPIAINF